MYIYIYSCMYICIYIYISWNQHVWWLNPWSTPKSNPARYKISIFSISVDRAADLLCSRVLFRIETNLGIRSYVLIDMYIYICMYIYFFSLHSDWVFPDACMLSCHKSCFSGGMWTWKFPRTFTSHQWLLIRGLENFAKMFSACGRWIVVRHRSSTRSLKIWVISWC